jgi:hypothetical protein
MYKIYLSFINVCIRDIYSLLMLSGQNYITTPPLKLKNKVYRLYISHESSGKGLIIFIL